MQSLAGFTAEQRKATEDAMDMLNAAGLCFVVVVGLEETAAGGVLSNMPTDAAIGGLLAGLLRTAEASAPIDIPHETRQ